MDPNTSGTPTGQPADTTSTPTSLRPPTVPEAETLPSADEVAAPEASPAPAAGQVPDLTSPAKPADPVPAVDPAESAPTDESPELSVPAGPAEPVVNGVPAAPSRPHRSRRWLVPLVVFVVLVLLAGGYVFGFYLPNMPANVYKQALNNTAAGYDSLVHYSQSQAAQSYKGYKLDGSFKISGGGDAGDGTLSGQSDGKNGTGKLDFDLMGQKFTANVRVITASGQTNPDVYLQLTGIKGALDAYGLNALDSLDGQWLTIDHTLFDSVAGNAAGGNAAKLTVPTAKQAQDMLAKVGTVNRDYLFTTRSDTAVLTNKKYLGKSTQDGRQAYGYEVGYNKAHLKAYVSSLGKALDSSQLNTWAKQVYDGKSLSDVLDLTQMQKDVDNLKGSETFRLYVDAKTKLVSRLEFTDRSDNSTFFITQNYTGGSVYPFSVGISGSPESNGTLRFQLDTKTNTYTFDLSMTPGTKATGGESVTATAHLSVKPTNDNVKVTAPAGAKSITNVLNELGLSGGTSEPAADNVAADGESLFTLTQ
jgi:hypothetical protein